MLPNIVMNNMCSGSMQYLSSTRRVYWSFLASVHVTVIATIILFLILLFSDSGGMHSRPYHKKLHVLV